MLVSSFTIVTVNAVAVVLLVYTSLLVHADMTIAVIYAFIILILCANIAHNISRRVHRRRAELRKNGLNGLNGLNEL